MNAMKFDIIKNTRVSNSELQKGIDGLLALGLRHCDAVALGRADRLGEPMDKHAMVQHIMSGGLTAVQEYRATADLAFLKTAVLTAHESMVRAMQETSEAFREGLCVTEAECCDIMQKRDDIESMLHVLDIDAPTYWRHSEQEGHELMLLILMEFPDIADRWPVLPESWTATRPWWAGRYSARDQEEFLVSAYNTRARDLKGPIIDACSCGRVARWTSDKNVLMCDTCMPWRPSYMQDVDPIEQEVLNGTTLGTLQKAFYEIFQAGN